jgi:hypothetical protein
VGESGGGLGGGGDGGGHGCGGARAERSVEHLAGSRQVKVERRGSGLRVARRGACVLACWVGSCGRLAAVACGGPAGVTW